ncbi:hypothetical protein EXIGLDRAFT_843339 [Exidia glandulosa HHB12029]|uniref:MYND-type domain-containing protein n=1 Tax=Exidia glandulosa HHB12029 TaxID=1314781 RepID=A0A165CR38_EXIGL|nr:hypothetical protein EXIGLDRAFT_843339 [Exidia glandulosa HHB12029]
MADAFDLEIRRDVFCSQCKKWSRDPANLKRCSRCKASLYCDAACQKKHWSTHKVFCLPAPGHWSEKYRECQDGSMHQGRLELITWEGVVTDYDGEVTRTGWASAELEDVDELKQIFETHFHSDEEQFYLYRRFAFRWNCCGVKGNRVAGCDHHSARFPVPCTCDFCVMGRPVPDDLEAENAAEHSVARHGLTIPRTPDPRSFNRAMAAFTAASRTTMGLGM